MYNVGLPYAFASFYAITILHRSPVPEAAVAPWQKLIGYITPGEMFSDYYLAGAMRTYGRRGWFFSVPYLGIQLKTSGLLFNRLLAGTPIEHMAIAVC